LGNGPVIKGIDPEKGGKKAALNKRFVGTAKEGGWERVSDGDSRKIA